MKILKFLKKRKEIKDQLEKALAEGLITKEELLRLRFERAETTYKNYLKDKKEK